jgi:hypothetical protein
MIFMICIGAAILSMSNSVFADDIYISQNSQGSDTGANCSNSHSATWFNTSSNWSNPKQSGKIGPGDIVHLCGTINTELTAQNDGSRGSPITIYFESNAKLSQASGTLMSLSGRNYLVIDGGTNGIMENTDNGTALGHQAVTTAIYARPVSNIEIKNLTIQNMYVHTSVSDGSNSNLTGGNAVNLNGFTGSISIHNNTFHDICWAISGSSGRGVTSYSVHDNTFYNYDHGIAAGANTSGSTVNFYNNHFGTTANWDTTANTFHHDGIHIFFDAGATLAGVNIYNNLFDGNWGYNVTGHIFLECDYTHANLYACSNFNIYNNVHIQYAGNNLNEGFLDLTGTGHRIMNNTYLGSGVTNSTCVVGNNAQYVGFQNNLVSGCTTFISFTKGYSLARGLVNNNLYTNAVAGGNSPWSAAGVNANTLAAWQTNTGQEVNSVQTVGATFDSSGHLIGGSQSLRIGSNLTSLGIVPLNIDMDGRQRPSSEPWAVGAYEEPVLPAPALRINSLSN